jgi:hypothetical protein
VRGGVVLARFLGVVRCVEMMAVREMGVLCRLFVCAAAVMGRRVAMMFGRLLMVLGRLFVMLCQLVRIHVDLRLGGQAVRATILARMR